YLAENGWTRGDFKNGDGAVCLHGAVMYCRPQDGDDQIITQVLNRRGFDYDWNDRAAENVQEVVAALAKDITDGELAEVFGPQWEQIVALTRRARALTLDEAKRLAAA